MSTTRCWQEKEVLGCDRFATPLVGLPAERRLYVLRFARFCEASLDIFGSEGVLSFPDADIRSAPPGSSAQRSCDRAGTRRTTSCSRRTDL
eukprot:6542759-Pyramimonas_sp.AAC.1